MKEILIVILLLIMVDSVQNLQQYTLFRRIVIDNPIYHRLGFFDDLSSLVIYDQTSPLAFEINGYNYTLKDTWELQNAATALHFFTDVRALSNIIYSTELQLRQRTFKLNGLKYVDNQLTNVGNIQQIDVSSDGFYYAFFCQDDSKLYIGNVSVFATRQFLSLRDYSERGLISSIAWKPTSHQIIVTGARLTDNLTFTQLYDYDLNSAVDLTNINKQVILDSSFSKFGDKIYFIERNNQKVVKVYEFASRTLSDLAFETTNELISISIRGHFLAVSDGSQIVILNLVSGANYGTYESIALGNGLSPDGSDLVALTNSQALSIDVYKLCIADHSFFNEVSDQCQPCSDTCNQCYFQSSRCSSCYDQYYLSDKHCLLCSDAIVGCITCSSSVLCLQCNQTQHRINTYDGRCECESGYFEDLDTCLNCMIGCLLCKSADICDKCDETRHWNESINKCSCSSGYIEIAKVCQSCSTFLQECQTCKSTKACLSCKEGYTLNSQTSQCEANSSSNLVLIVLISIGSVLVLAGVLILFLKVRRGKKKETLLQSDTTGQQRIDS